MRHSLEWSVLCFDALLELSDFTTTINIRDTFELKFLSSDGEELAISRLKMLSHVELSNNTNNESVTGISLSIHKTTVSNVCSVYNMEIFINWLSSCDTKSFLDYLNQHFENHLYFEVFDVINPFGTQNIRFQSHPFIINTRYFSISERMDYLINRAENTSDSGQVYKFIPNDFYGLNSTYTNLNLLFDNACKYLCLKFLANIASIDNTGQVAWKIHGYKTIDSEKNPLNLVSGKIDELYKIYEWAYFGGSCSDKLGLIRNIFSIHLDPQQKVLIDSSVWDAIHSNYKIYLNGNIQSYLEVKNKIGDAVIESITKTYALSDELIDSFKINIGAVATFVISIVVVSGVKDLEPEKAFSAPYTLILLVMCAISWGWSVTIKQNVEKRFIDYTDHLKSALSINYDSFLMQDELTKLIDPTINKSKTYFDDQIKDFTKYWRIFLGVISMTFIFGFCCFSVTVHDISKQALTSLNTQVSLKSDQILRYLSQPEPIQNNETHKSH